MSENYINLTLENLDEEHLCCAIGDKKHQDGVTCKKKWLRERIPEGHVFRKLDAKGKVFIEYAPLETAWVPVEGDNYMFIYCFWVSGSFKGKNHGKDLLEYCINDAKQKRKSGVCALSSKKKKPFLSDPKFLKKYGFETADQIGDYELMALSFDGSKPSFVNIAKAGEIDSSDLAIYYSNQCPFINNSIGQIREYCDSAGIKIDFIEVDTLKKAKELPQPFNNWAAFKDGEFVTNHIMNESYFKKMILGGK